MTLQEQLRAQSSDPRNRNWELCLRAADELDRLQAENEAPRRLLLEAKREMEKSMLWEGGTSFSYMVETIDAAMKEQKT